MKLFEREKKDTIGSIEHIVIQNRRLVFLAWLLSLSILGILAFTLTVFSLKEDKVVTLDSTGRPEIVTPKPDAVFPAEVQHFTTTALTNILEVSYVDFLDDPGRARFYARIRPYFWGEVYEDFLHAYMKSDYVASLMKSRSVVRLSFPAAFDMIFPEKGKGFRYLIVSGKITITSYAVGGGVSVIEKKYELHLEKGKRVVENPYGLYIVIFTEK